MARYPKALTVCKADVQVHAEPPVPSQLRNRAGKARLKSQSLCSSETRTQPNGNILPPGYSCAAAGGGGVIISGPDGYKYKAVPPIEGRKERFVSVGLKVSDLPTSSAYWCDLLGMSRFSEPAPASEGEAGQFLSETVGYGEGQVSMNYIYRGACASLFSRLTCAVFNAWSHAVDRSAGVRT